MAEFEIIGNVAIIKDGVAIFAEGITEIGFAFSCCSSLKSIVIPEYRIEAPQNEWEITKKEVSLLVLSK